MVNPMNRLVVGVIASLMLASCTSTKVSVEKMSNMEIALYNSSVSFMEQVYCIEDIRLGSHIRQRTCATLQEMQDYNANQIGIVNTASAGNSIFR